MNTFPIRIVFFMSFLLITGVPAPKLSFAQDFTETGGYVVIGGINAFEDFDSPEDTDVDDAMGFQFRGGYRFNDYLAAEAEFDWLDGFDLEFDIPDEGREKLTVDSFLITANAKAYLPLGRFQPYALIGAGVMFADLRTSYPVGTICRPGYWGWWCSSTYARIDDSAAFAMKFGAGADLHLNEQWAITIDGAYVNPFTTLEDLKYMSLAWGIRYRY